MKNKLQAELKDLAKKILNDEQQISTASLKLQARELYEKITVLAYAEENLESLTSGAQPETSGKAPLEFSREVEEKTVEQIQLRMQESTLPKEEVSKPIEKVPAKEENAPAPTAQEEKDEYLPDGTEYNDADAITEPVTEKIKDIVAHMSPETQNLDHMINNIISKNGLDHVREIPPASKPDFRNIGVDYDNLPNFEPVKKQDKEQRPRSLNDRLKNGINIGLNERLSFIRHLFDGKTADYNRVVSQLNTFDSVTEAKKFIQLVVKPDYKNWVGKEEYEQKFLELVENKFKQ